MARRAEFVALAGEWAFREGWSDAGPIGAEYRLGVSYAGGSLEIE
jgi:hypothetical protein